VAYDGTMPEKKTERISLKSLDIKLKNLDAKFEQKFSALDIRIDGLEASERCTGVLLEEMNGKLSLLLEGYMGHDTRIVNLEDRMDKVERKADTLS
jgi:hypothetical protein